MTNHRLTLALAATLFALPATAQDGVNTVLRDANATRPVFAVFDIRPANVSQSAIQEALAGALRTHYNDLNINQGMAPHPLPTGAPRMTFTQAGVSVGTIDIPRCQGATTQIFARDSSMAQYGERTGVQTCVFPYKDGLRVNVYAVFSQRSGGANPMVLGAMLGRFIGSAVGLGDSSKFIDKTIDDMEERLKALAPATQLVELQPERQGKTVAADPAPAATVASDTSAGQVQPGGAIIPATLIAPQAATRGSTTPPSPLSAQTANALQARKDLTGMGLTYYSQEQFLDAVKRNDLIASELFLVAGGIDPKQHNKAGQNARNLSRSAEMTGLLERLAP